MATLETRISELATRVATEFNTVRTEIGVGGGAPQVFVQQTRPSAAGPWMWWQTDAGGNLLNLIVNDGVA